MSTKSKTTFGYDNVFGDYLEASDDVSSEYQNWILSFFKPKLQGRILEVGSGTGNVSKSLIEMIEKPKENYFLLEPSDELISKTKKTNEKFLKLPPENINHGTIEILPKTKKYNCILYINVLEHIEDDIEELKRVYSKLENGGAVCIFVPALEQLYSKRDWRVGHYRRYHKGELERKLKIAGFNIEKLTYFDFVGAFLWYIKFVFLKSDKINKSQVGFFNKIIVPISKLLQFDFLPFGKNLVAIAKKS
jgi:SAM-dependent methyltransferase